MNMLFTPAKIGNMQIKNRAVRSATNEHLSQPDGGFSPEWVDATVELARHEVGLVISGHATVERTQRADPGQPVLDCLTDTAPIARAAEQIHSCGAKFVVQLSHSGIKGDVKTNGRPAMAPEDFTLAQLDELVEKYAFAAEACKNAGVDGVQIHNAHGYLLSNFLNPNENKRTDDYGGSLQNRFRLIGRIIAAVRARCGADYPILVKADCNGCGDLPALARLYAAAGVDAVEISGIDFNKKGGQKTPFYLQEAKEILSEVTVPVIPVGGVFNAATANAVLSEGFAFVSFSRALICEPDFIEKMKQDEQYQSKCLACNGCYTVYRKKPMRCVQHTVESEQLKKLFF